tara:strand:- start:817 stop:2736 length:1920 start_codon:yes stop_codon:yes gene_type:complete
MSNNKDFGIHFDLPKNQSNVIKVIGVGGGGSNAINHMFKQGIKGVDFVICNTDSQALNSSGVSNKIQLGVSLTEGLGAGANPDIGEKAAIESLEDIKSMLTTNTKMVFITAGMGGGTGTGAAPIIAKMAMDLDILTVGIVTTPFHFEGKIRNIQANKGIEKLRKVVDSLVIVNNNKLREVYGNLGFKAGFSKADEVLSTAARGIAEVITHHYTQNIDLKDAKTVLSRSGTAIMGASTAIGAGRAKKAITNALDSPLLNDNKISGAKNVLLLIVSGSKEITIDEIGEINEYIQSEAGYGANIIMGVGEDNNLAEAISVTIIATGFNAHQQNEITNVEPKKVVHALDNDQLIGLEFDFSEGFIENKKDISNNQITDDGDFVSEISDRQNSEAIDLIPTSEIIKSFDVEYEELMGNVLEDNFIINEISSIQDNKDKDMNEDQTTLSFDLPISESVKKLSDNKNTEVFKLEDNVNNVEIDEYIELVPVSKVCPAGEETFTLDDHILLEETDQEFVMDSPAVFDEIEPEDDLEQDMVLTKIKIRESKVSSEPEVSANPFDNPISKTLRDRADERRKKMKAFNYKFNITKIDDYEKEPAYKRQGVELTDSGLESETNISRTSISSDENEEDQVRSNNSFLHDNVD